MVPIDGTVGVFDDTVINIIHLSLATRLVARIDYRAADGSITTRDIEPRDIDRNLCRAWCHLRHEMRTFRIDRIASARILPDMFMPDGPHVDVGNWRQHL